VIQACSDSPEIIAEGRENPGWAGTSQSSLFFFCRCSWLFAHSSVTPGSNLRLERYQETALHRDAGGEDNLSKNNMKRIALMLLGLAWATSLFAQTADPGAAEKPKLPARPQWEQRRHLIWDRLDLTDEQKEKLKQIREEDRQSLRSAWAEAKIAQESLHAALLANPENTADIQTKATNWANAISTRTVQFALHEAKVSQVLTPEQRVVLDEAIKGMRRWHRRDGGPENGRGRSERPWEKMNPASRPAAPAATPSVTPTAPTN
jgi:Spy/CpxP family protein refolding chaperone